jgi:hypothetical protein
MRMFDTFLKEFTTQSNTAWKKQKTAYIRWECLIRSLKSSLHNQIQPEKKQRTAYIRWECLIRSLKSSLHNQIQPEKKCCVGYTNIIET